MRIENIMPQEYVTADVPSATSELSVSEGDRIESTVLFVGDDVVHLKTEDGALLRARIQGDVLLEVGSKAILTVVEASGSGIVLKPVAAGDGSGRDAAIPEGLQGNAVIEEFSRQLEQLRFPVTEKILLGMQEILNRDPTMSIKQAAFLAANGIDPEDSLLAAMKLLSESGEKTAELIGKLYQSLTGQTASETGAPPEPAPPLQPGNTQQTAANNPPAPEVAQSAAASGGQETVAQVVTSPETGNVAANNTATATTIIPNEQANESIIINEARADAPVSAEASVSIETPVTAGAPVPADAPVETVRQDAQSSETAAQQPQVQSGQPRPEQPQTGQTANPPRPEAATEAPPDRTAAAPAAPRTLPTETAARAESAFPLEAGIASLADMESNTIMSMLTKMPAFKNIPEKQIADFSEIIKTVAVTNRAMEEMGIKTEDRAGQLVKEIFARLDDADTQPDAVLKRARDELSVRLAFVKDAVGRSGMAGREELAAQITRVENHVRLVNNVEQFVYTQIPLELAGEQKTAELYIFRQRKDTKRIDPENAKILLALDMTHMGHIEAFIGVLGKEVSLQIDIADDAAGDFILQHTSALHKLLSESGFKLGSARVRNYGERTTAEDALLSLFMYEKSVKTGFDILA